MHYNKSHLKHNKQTNDDDYSLDEVRRAILGVCHLPVRWQRAEVAGGEGLGIGRRTFQRLFAREGRRGQVVVVIGYVVRRRAAPSSRARAVALTLAVRGLRAAGIRGRVERTDRRRAAKRRRLQRLLGRLGRAVVVTCEQHGHFGHQMNGISGTIDIYQYQSHIISSLMHYVARNACYCYYLRATWSFGHQMNGILGT